MAAVEHRKLSSIDPETLSAVTREVLARLRQKQSSGSSEHASPGVQASKTNRTAACLAERVVTASTIARLPQGTAELFLNGSAVVTPSALDELRGRGITVNRTAANPVAKSADDASGKAVSAGKIVDFTQPQRADTVAQQLSRRGITLDARIILTDTPAQELYHQCAQHRQVAAMVGSIDDVRRFAEELDVKVWVLDMKRLNLTAAVNVCALISRIRRPGS